jgi:C4-dicarboxylate-specific signal transduction histidine kinase
VELKAMGVYDLPVAQENKEFRGTYGVARDITDRKRLEAQLLQAQKMKAIGTLAGGVAHDFNNLLMGIEGHTSLMFLNVNADHPHFEHIKGIEHMVKRGADLTKQLLGFARGGK